MSGARHCVHCQGTVIKPHAVPHAPAATVACSVHCAAAAEQIFSAGLEDYYQYRQDAGASGSVPSDSTPPVRNWETYERPALRRTFVQSLDGGIERADLLIQGVHCAACTWLIENALQKHSGVVSVAVNPLTTRAEISWHSNQITLATLLESIGSLGFRPLPFTGQATHNAMEQERRLALRRLLVAGLGMMQVTSYAVALYAGAFQGMDAQTQTFLRLISLLVATPVVLYSGAPFFSGAWRNLRARSLGMDVPVALAIGSAWAASVWNTFSGGGEVYFDSATMFVFFLSGTRYLEAAGRYKALDLTHTLAQHLPTTALRITAGGNEEVGVMELAANDVVMVTPGQAFPADGLLLDQETRIDESMLTGESTPVCRNMGESVVAGTVNLQSAVRIRVEATGNNTVLAQIGRLVMRAGQERPRLLQLTDRVASVFVAVILSIALLTGLYWWFAAPERVFEIVLTVLVVTCPCALAIATPAALTIATSRLARDGFLIRRGGALPALAAVSRVIFDKTGTLTDNSLQISQTFTRADCSVEEAIGLAAALEAQSAHPVSRAFKGAGDGRSADTVRSVEGGGLEGCIGERQLRIGTHDFVRALADPVQQRGTEPVVPPTTQRLLYLGDSTGILACFEIAEQIRGGAAELLSGLQQLDISSLIASGDQPQPVAALADRIGATRWQAGMLPADKLKLLRKLQAQGERVAAVGDGINDSPLLAGADVSIAMGSGTALAHHSADCVWLGNQLNGLIQAFTTARKTMRIVKQNLAWALSYNLLAIPLAVSGLIAPWMAALGMSLSSLLVMLNALRLGRTDQRQRPAQSAARPPETTADSTGPAGCCKTAAAGKVA